MKRNEDEQSCEEGTRSSNSNGNDGNSTSRCIQEVSVQLWQRRIRFSTQAALVRCKPEKRMSTRRRRRTRTPLTWSPSFLGPADDMPTSEPSSVSTSFSPRVTLHSHPGTRREAQTSMIPNRSIGLSASVSGAGAPQCQSCARVDPRVPRVRRESPRNQANLPTPTIYSNANIPITYVLRWLISLRFAGIVDARLRACE